MKWSKYFTYVKQYEHSSTNQHGCRYKQTGIKKLSVARMIANRTDADDLEILILLSHYLDTPVRYDFESSPQTAYIEVVSNEQLK